MPKRTDIRRVLVIGSGPIVIGQACEFDYSGTQACKALRAEGLEVVLVNSNPATIMTDPEVSHVCLNDDVVEGLRCLDVPAFSVQYHPEAAAGPHDAGYLFDRFADLMTTARDGKDA